MKIARPFILLLLGGFGIGFIYIGCGWKAALGVFLVHWSINLDQRFRSDEMFKDIEKAVIKIAMKVK